VATSTFSGVTSEMSGLTTYLVGALVYREQFWIATTVTVASMLLLELKSRVGRLDQADPIRGDPDLHQVPSAHRGDFAVLPNQEFGPFQINPSRPGWWWWR